MRALPKPLLLWQASRCRGRRPALLHTAPVALAFLWSVWFGDCRIPCGHLLFTFWPAALAHVDRAIGPKRSVGSGRSLTGISRKQLESLIIVITLIGAATNRVPRLISLDMRSCFTHHHRRLVIWLLHNRIRHPAHIRVCFRGCDGT